MKEKYLIERGLYVTLCEFDSSDQFDYFLQSCRDECKEINASVESEDIPDYAKTYYGFQYRDDFSETDDDKRWRELEEGDEQPFFFVLTKIYPGSVLADATKIPISFIDKQANWDTQKKYSGSDMGAMQHYLDRAAQVQKNMKGRQRAPRTKNIDLERAVDCVLMDGLT
jgi:hypothetical protein